jgi:RNA polymerase sigma-70 factor (ECF subfamily)
MAVTQPDPASAEAPGWETIEELFAALESPLLSYAMRLTGERGAAEDIVQEAFMRLHEQFKEVREPRRWLYRTAHNLALNHQRKAGKVVPFETITADGTLQTAETADPQPLPDEQIAHLEGVGLVRLSIEALDERSRQLIRLKFNDDLSYKEISAQTGLTVGHVGYLLHHALRAIAAELAKNGVVP